MIDSVSNSPVLRIFINYRREDTSGHAGRLYDALTAHFGEDCVFMDIDTIRPGRDFTEALDAAIGECDVLLALIGTSWLTSTDEFARRRLDSADDFVRRELEAALCRGIVIIPLLVHDVKMPLAKQLPHSLRAIATRHAVELSDLRWRSDVHTLINELDRLRREKIKPPRDAQPEPARGSHASPRSEQTILQQVIASLSLVPHPEQRLVRTARELAGVVRAQEAAELARMLADTGDARPAEVGYVQPALLHWRTDGGRRGGTQSQILDYYRELRRGRLVVQGPAGSGKTMLVMRLVLDLAAAFPGLGDPGWGGDGPRVRVPVRLSAPTFDPAAGSGRVEEIAADDVAARLDAWVAAQLRLIYGMDAKQAVDLVAEGWVLPVLDGVDEMDPPDEPPRRAAALLAALNQPTATGLRRVVLTCRTERYTQLAEGRDIDHGPQVLQDATVVEAEPLTVSAVREFLVYRFPDPAGSSLGEPRWRPVLKRLERPRPGDPLVAALRSPLRLFLAIAGYRTPTLEPAELTQYHTAKSLDDHLFSLLVPAATAYRRRLGNDSYSAEHVTLWLLTLARHLQAEDQAGRSGTDVLLHNLWPAAGQRLPRYVSALVITGACAAPLLWVGIGYLLGLGLPRDFGAALSVPLCVGIVAIAAWRSSRVATKPERLDLRILGTRRGRLHFAVRLAAGLAVGLVAGLVFGLAIGYVEGIAFGLVAGLAFGVANGLVRRPQAIDLPHRLVSQGVMHTSAMFVGGLCVWPAFAFARGGERGLMFGLALGIALGVVFAAASPWPRYLAACLLLSRRHELPLRLAVFLDWAYEAGLMRLAGIAVQFRHREFQDWLSRRSVNAADKDKAARARGLLQLATAHSQIGDHLAASKTTSEAVELYRELVALNRDAYLPDLAAAVKDLAIHLGEAGSRAEGLSAAQEAVDLRRELIALNRDAHLPDLATAVTTLANHLAETGHRAEALTAAQEAVDLRRELVALNRDAYLPNLAGAVNNLAVHLAETGHRAEALTTAQEAVDLRRELVALNRDAYLPDLAGSVNNLAVNLAETGRRAEALTAAQEALRLYQESWQIHGDVFAGEVSAAGQLVTRLQ